MFNKKIKKELEVVSNNVSKLITSDKLQNEINEIQGKVNEQFCDKIIKLKQSLNETQNLIIDMIKNKMIDDKKVSVA